MHRHTSSRNAEAGRARKTGKNQENQEEPGKAGKPGRTRVSWQLETGQLLLSELNLVLQEDLDRFNGTALNKELKSVR